MDVIDPQVAGILALVVMIAQLIGKSIPDSATGFLGFLRKLAKFIGLYVPNNKS